MGTQDGVSGTLAAPVPATRRTTQRHGRRPRNITEYYTGRTLETSRDPKLQERQLESDLQEDF